MYANGYVGTGEDAVRIRRQEKVSVAARVGQGLHACSAPGSLAGFAAAFVDVLPRPQPSPLLFATGTREREEQARCTAQSQARGGTAGWAETVCGHHHRGFTSQAPPWLQAGMQGAVTALS